jgi:hypothetical protein
MLNELKNEANMTRTENFAATHRTTMSGCLDLFAAIGALRRAEGGEIVSRFVRAYAEDADLAMKLLFFGRDIRGGLGERRVFRTILNWLAVHEPASAVKNIGYIAEFGRYDDLLVLIDTPCEKAALEYIAGIFCSDMEALNNGGSVTLLAKWLPSVNTSNPDAVRMGRFIARSLGLKDAEYRKALVRLRAQIRIIENNLREMDYSFDYGKQPSKAMFKYRKAFIRNDGERYGRFIQRVVSGEAKLHTGTLAPYDIVAPLLGGSFFGKRAMISEAERLSIDATWKAQEDFTNGENALVVVDGSGSMYGGTNPMPYAVAMSLGVYFAERNTGKFQNHFITFSESPQLVEIKGRDIVEKMRYCMDYNEVANTNIQKVFELILGAAVKHSVPQNEMPATLYIISDMEFDYCAKGANMTNFEYAKQLYEGYGYALPQVVFWNVDSRNRQQPVTQNEQGVALVSGNTARIFEMLKSGTLSPHAFMMEVLGTERYKMIAA